ncbi:PKD domain-containing protein [bacterium]|nr:PKD domain-containing protein [bacterium]UNM09249.1 MAG: PKD domain-containing protein [Planctomycetales bacterium]
MRLPGSLAILALLIFISACGGTADRAGVQLAGAAGFDVEQELPDAKLALPADGVQPWEALDGQGHVLPSGRGSSSITANTIFTPGVELFLSAGDAVPNGEALRLNATSTNDIAYAIYRISLQDQQPGIVSIDANLLGPKSRYYVGVSNYGGVRWEWNGPFSDGRIRLPVLTDGNGNYTSEFGNTFVTVLAEAGNSLDIVGVGVNQYDPADAIKPSSPSGLALTPVNGGIELAWNPVPANDIAGYIVYHSGQPFSNPHAAGVKRVRQLEGAPRHILSGLSARTYIAVSALDFGGNESDPTAVLNALPLAGSPGQLMLATDMVSGKLNQAAGLVASGADLYDWDLDGDGVFELTDDASGSQQAYTGASGVIRPAVRGRDALGEAVALGSVSLLIIGNNRPVASAVADPQSGPAPLSVQFTGTAEDLEDDLSALEFAWDFNGDGIYEDNTDLLQPPATDYIVDGTWNAKFRVTDSEGAWDVDSVAISVGEGLGGWPTAALSASSMRVEKNVPVSFDASASTDAGGGITNYEWDLDGDGIFSEAGNGEAALEGQPLISLWWSEPGSYPVGVRVTDADGHTGTAGLEVAVTGWRITALELPVEPVNDIVLLDVHGSPALFYYDNDTDDLLYVRASNPQGSQWPASTLLSINSYTRGKRSALMVDGRPALGFSGTGAPGLKFIHASDETGGSWGSPTTIDPTSGSTFYVDALQVAGNPAFAYRDSANAKLRYIRAADATASSWDTPVDVDTQDIPGNFCSMAIVNGNPAISYNLFNGQDLAYVRATDAAGSSWGTRVIITTTSNTGYYTTLAVVQGAPAIGYQLNTGADLMFVRANDADGQSWADPLPVATASLAGYSANMLIHNGIPHIFHHDNTTAGMMLSVADGPLGTGWAEPFLVDGDPDVGDGVCVIHLGGRLAIAYYDNPNSDIRFAIQY